MKLRNSFLIAAGVFFFAVAFINFAKAGEDGGIGIDPGDYGPVVCYDMIRQNEPCMSYVHWKYDENIGIRKYLISENSMEDGWNGPIENMEGNKDVCLQAPYGVCVPTECSSLETLKTTYGI